MYAYIDETGNTGENLFDHNQPVFLTGALITKTNFDLLYKKRVESICDKIGVESLHANELGFGRLEDIASDLLIVLKKSDARFFLSRIAKVDLAATKLVDTIFDSGENLSVPWHVYNYRPLRLLLVFKVAYLLNEDILKLFWSSLMDTRIKRGYEKFKRVLHDILLRVEELPDERSIELVSEAVQWAIDNPEAIHLHPNARINKYGHLPNMAVFPELLGGIDLFSKKWNRPVREIIHDRQSQFGPFLKTWHEIISNAKAGILTLPGGEKHSLRKVDGSKFIMSNSEESAGIQIVDCILWFFKKIEDGKKIPANCAKMMNHVFSKGFYHEISIDAILKYLESTFAQWDNTPLSPEQIEKAQELLKFGESRRQEEMKKYYQKKHGETLIEL